MNGHSVVCLCEILLLENNERILSFTLFNHVGRIRVAVRPNAVVLLDRRHRHRSGDHCHLPFPAMASYHAQGIILR